ADSALPSLFSLRQMQCPPDRFVQLTSYAHGIILLKTGDSEAYLVRKDAVDPTAIVSESLQIPLQCGDVSWVGHQLFVGLKIINPAPAISEGVISLAHRRHLVKQVVFIARCERVRRTVGEDFLVDDEAANAIAGEQHSSQNKYDS